jgi:hypothetical protein
MRILRTHRIVIGPDSQCQVICLLFTLRPDISKIILESNYTKKKSHKALKMKLSALIVFASSCEAGRQQHRDGEMSNPLAKETAWQRQLKAFRQCKRSKCQTECPDKNWLQESCFTCLKTSQCPLPFRK